MLFLLLHLSACSQPEAAEPPLPDGAEALRAALQSFQTMRLWIGSGGRNDITGGRFWFGKEFVLSVRADATATVDIQGQRSRYWWGDTGHTVDGSVTGTSHPPESRLPYPGDFAGMPDTEQWVAQVVSALRSPDTVWRARSPGHYGWGHPTDSYAELTLPVLEPSGCHMFFHFSRAVLRDIMFQCSRTQSLVLGVLRIEVDPPLPPTWFDADAPEFDTRTKGEFQAGEPTVPLDPGFYAPGATPPLSWRGDGPGGQ